MGPREVAANPVASAGTPASFGGSVATSVGLSVAPLVDPLSGEATAAPSFGAPPCHASVGASAVWAMAAPATTPPAAAT